MVSSTPEPIDFDQTTSDKDVVIIRPTKGWVPLNIKELFSYRELIWVLAWRDVLARYKQTIVGIAWAVLQPLVAMIVFTVVFGKLAKIPSDGLRYSVFCLAGTLMWQYFSASAQSSSNCLRNNVHLLTKVHFPRLAIPLACILPPLVDFVAGFLVLMAVMLHYDYYPTWRILTIPLFLGLAMVTALGIGLWLSALTIEYRDIHHVLPFLMQLAMFASPVVYSSSLVPDGLRQFFGLNPMAGVIAGFRWALFGTPVAPGPPMLFLSGLMACVILVSGAYYFRRTERSFADFV